MPVVLEPSVVDWLLFGTTISETLVCNLYVPCVLVVLKIIPFFPYLYNLWYPNGTYPLFSLFMLCFWTRNARLLGCHILIAHTSNAKLALLRWSPPVRQVPYTRLNPFLVHLVNLS